MADQSIEKVVYGPRTEKALRDTGTYIDPRLETELTDALRAIAVEDGWVDSKQLGEVKVLIEIESDLAKPTTTPKYGKPVYHLKLRGTTPAKTFDSLEADIGSYIREKGLQNVGTANSGMRVVGDNLRNVLDALVHGFIEKHSPHNTVDYESILADPGVAGAGEGESAARPKRWAGAAGGARRGSVGGRED